jgi:flagellar motor switch/type III secretory pathway protein FliN
VSLTARPFILHSREHLERLRCLLASVVDRWAVDWSENAVQGSALQMDAAVPTGDAGRSWRGYAKAGHNRCIAYGLEGIDRRELARAIVTGSRVSELLNVPHDVAWVAIAEARDALRDALFEALLGCSLEAVSLAPTLPIDVFAVGSGFVRIHHAALAIDLYVSLPPPATSMSSGDPISPLEDALLNAPVTLSVLAGGVELSVQDIASLQMGDVIRLTSKFSDSVVVAGPDRRLLFDARLGQFDGHVAVGLSSTHNA